MTLSLTKSTDTATHVGGLLYLLSAFLLGLQVKVTFVTGDAFSLCTLQLILQSQVKSAPLLHTHTHTHSPKTMKLTSQRTAKDTDHLMSLVWGCGRF